MLLAAGTAALYNQGCPFLLQQLQLLHSIAAELLGCWQPPQVVGAYITALLHGRLQHMNHRGTIQILRAR